MIFFSLPKRIFRQAEQPGAESTGLFFVLLHGMQLDAVAHDQLGDPVGRPLCVKG